MAVPPFAAAAPQLLGVLDAEERARAARFAFDADRDAFVAAHALLRTALGAALGISSAAVRFTRAPGGRPELAGIAAREITFSLTHTRTLVACAVGPAVPLGIDAEAEADTSPDETLLPSCCTPRERAYLERLDPDCRTRAFAQMWTAKEALLKALGVGMMISPSEVDCALDPLRVLRAPEVEGRGRWFVRTYEPRPHVALTFVAYVPHDLGEPSVAELCDSDYGATVTVTS